MDGRFRGFGRITRFRGRPLVLGTVQSEAPRKTLATNARKRITSLIVTLSPVDYVILTLYFAFVIGIGWKLRKSATSASEFLTAGHHVPVWITSLAFLAANLGAQEVVG